MPPRTAAGQYFISHLFSFIFVCLLVRLSVFLCSSASLYFFNLSVQLFHRSCFLQNEAELARAQTGQRAKQKWYSLVTIFQYAVTKIRYQDVSRRIDQSVDQLASPVLDSSKKKWGSLRSVINISRSEIQTSAVSRLSKARVRFIGPRDVTCPTSAF